MDRTITESDADLLAVIWPDGRWRTMTEMEIIRALTDMTHPRRNDETTE